MSNIRFTTTLSNEFATLFASCEIQPEKFDEVDDIVDRILADKNRYETVQRKLGIPWFFVAVIHNMESGGRFDRHLHNGDPLTKRTRQVPAGRPLDGEPPFTWEASATDALLMKRLDQIDAWSLSRILYELERYNGWGYRRFHPDVL
ncbi:MAG: hypothetical protein OEM63_15045, partial [Gammaproteobacteria bacterium]|nr:hypothetical protein [Gammaproteobacteria bacterium]